MTQEAATPRAVAGVVLPVKPKRTSLRSFQNELAVRIATRAISDVEEEVSKLGVLAGGRRFLVDLRLIDEVLYPQPVTSILLTHPWFLGLTNVRGDIYNVIDLSVFLGAPLTSGDSDTRWILFGRSSIGGSGALNIALVARQVLGLHSTKGYKMIESSSRKLAWCGQDWHDSSGHLWSELDLVELVKDPKFQLIERK